jgi:hypothetical protein
MILEALTPKAKSALKDGKNRLAYKKILTTE